MALSSFFHSGLLAFEELIKRGCFLDLLRRSWIERFHIIQFFPRDLRQVMDKMDQLRTVLRLLRSAAPDAAIAVKRMPLWMTQKSSPSDIDWVSGDFQSGALGYTFPPIGVLPLPSFAWQLAQWSAKCARAFFSTSAENGIGLTTFRCSFGIARWRICRAIRISNAWGSVVALKPVLNIWYPTHPNAPRAAKK